MCHLACPYPHSAQAHGSANVYGSGGRQGLATMGGYASSTPGYLECLDTRSFSTRHLRQDNQHTEETANRVAYARHVEVGWRTGQERVDCRSDLCSA